MKKLLVFLAILFLSFSLFAIDTSVSLGYQEKYTNRFTHAPYYISIDLWQDFNDLKIYGNYTNEFKDTDSWTFAPTQDYFTVGISYDFGAIQLSAEHMCQHPVMSNWVVNGIQGGYTKLEVTIH